MKKLTLVAGAVIALAAQSVLAAVAPEEAKKLGTTLTQSGAELSYRHNMPLQSTPVQVLPAGLANPALGQITPAQLANGGAPGAVGNTMHGVFNLIGSVSRTPLWDSATWMAEVTWNHEGVNDMPTPT